MKATRMMISACLLLGGLAQAGEGADDRLRDQLRQIALEKRQLEDENFQLKAKVAAAEGEVAKAKATPKAPPISPELLKLREQTRQQQQQIAALQAQLDGAGADQQELQAHLNAAQDSIRELRAGGQGLQAQLKVVAAREQACLDSNVKLGQLNFELLDGWQQEGFWQALREHESIAGLYRVRYETLLQEYRNRIEDTLVQPQSEPVAEPQPAAAAARQTPLRRSASR